MNLKEYYSDLHKTEAELEKQFPDGVVYVTSLFHRERNSTAGTTSSARAWNAARVITDATHRLATREEIQSFLQRQQEEYKRNSQSEQRNKKQFIVVVDQHEKVGEEAASVPPELVANKAVENVVAKQADKVK